MEESTCQCREHERCRFDPWVKKIPWSRKWQPIPIFLPEKFHGQEPSDTESSPLILEVRRVVITETTVGAGRAWKRTRGVSEEPVMLFLDVPMGTRMFSFCKNAIQLGTSVQVLMYRDFTD